MLAAQIEIQILTKRRQGFILTRMPIFLIVSCSNTMCLILQLKNATFDQIKINFSSHFANLSLSPNFSLSLSLLLSHAFLSLSSSPLSISLETLATHRPFLWRPFSFNSLPSLDTLSAGSFVPLVLLQLSPFLDASLLASWLCHLGFFSRCILFIVVICPPPLSVTSHHLRTVAHSFSSPLFFVDVPLISSSACLSSSSPLHFCRSPMAGSGGV